MFSVMSTNFALALKTSLSIRNDKVSMSTYVSFTNPVVLVICVFIWILSNDFGKSGYLKDAFFELIATLNLGI